MPVSFDKRTAAFVLIPIVTVIFIFIWSSSSSNYSPSNLLSLPSSSIVASSGYEDVEDQQQQDATPHDKVSSSSSSSSQSTEQAASKSTNTYPPNIVSSSSSSSSVSSSFNPSTLRMKNFTLFPHVPTEFRNRVEDLFYDASSSSWCRLTNKLSSTISTTDGEPESKKVDKFLRESVDHRNEHRFNFGETGCPVTQAVSCGTKGSKYAFQSHRRQRRKSKKNRVTTTENDEHSSNDNNNKTSSPSTTAPPSDEEIIFSPRKSRALVIYMVTAASNALQRDVENNNLDFFLEHGGIIEDKSALFDEVDYVFARVQINNERTQSDFIDCGVVSAKTLLPQSSGNHENKNKNDGEEQQHPKDPFEMFFELDEKKKKSKSAQFREEEYRKLWTRLLAKKRSGTMRFLLLPSSPCDLCNHARVLRYLGLDEHDEEKINTNKIDPRSSNKKNDYYSQYILLNSGVRGPYYFVSSSKSSATESAATDNTHQTKHKNKEDQQDDESSTDDEDEPISSWLDFVSLGGKDSIPNPRFDHLFNKRQCLKDVPSTDDHSSIHSELQYNKKQSRLRNQNRALFTETVTGEKENNNPFLSHSSCPSHVVSSSSISWEVALHPQTFFLSFPDTVLKSEIFPLFSKTCPSSSRDEDKSSSSTINKNKHFCVVNGEAAVGKSIVGLGHHSPDWALYSHSRRFFVRDFDGFDSKKKSEKYFYPLLAIEPRQNNIEGDNDENNKNNNNDNNNNNVEDMNPSHKWNNPCTSIFVKHGGDAFARGNIPKSVVRACAELETHYFGGAKWHDPESRDKQHQKNIVVVKDDSVFKYWELVDRMLDPTLNRQCRKIKNI